MALNGPILLVEDDQDDKDFMEETFKNLNLKNEIIWFTTTNKALKYLQQTGEQPFIIFCDINLPDQSGIEFKEIIDKDESLRRKSIPFIFFSTSVEQDTVNRAYTHMTVQGYFQKPSSFYDLKETLKTIVEYWKLCRHPNAI